MSRPLSLVVLSALILTSRVAFADDAVPCAAEAETVAKMKKRDPALQYPKDPDAVKHLEAAKRAFGVQQYDKAIEEYTAAGLADGAPLILYNLGQTYRAAKDYEKAIRQYQLFLDRGKPGAEVRALVKCHIQTMTAEMEQAASTAPPTGPAPEQTGDQDADASVAPEPAPIGAADDDEDDRDQPVEEIAPSPWSTSRKVALGTGVAGVLAVGAGVFFGLQAEGYKDDAAKLCPSNPCADADEANALSEKADSRALLANISYASGAALIIGATVLWFVGSPSDGNQDEVAITPQITPAFVGLGVSGTF